MKAINLTDDQAVIFTAMWDHAIENLESLQSVATAQARYLNPNASAEQIEAIVSEAFTVIRNPPQTVAINMIKALVVEYEGRLWDGELVETRRWYHVTPRQAIEHVTVAMKARGVPEEDIAWGETQIGYQVSDGRTDNPTYLYEICGWEDEGIAELGDEGEEYDGDA